MFLTFLLSAAVHELVMAIVTKKIRMYLFTLQVRSGSLCLVKRVVDDIVFFCAAVPNPSHRGWKAPVHQAE